MVTILTNRLRLNYPANFPHSLIKTLQALPQIHLCGTCGQKWISYNETLWIDFQS